MTLISHDYQACVLTFWKENLGNSKFKQNATGLQIHMQSHIVLSINCLHKTCLSHNTCLSCTLVNLNSLGALFILALVVTMVVSEQVYWDTVVYTRLTKINNVCLLFL